MSSNAKIFVIALSSPPIIELLQGIVSVLVSGVLLQSLLALPSWMQQCHCCHWAFLELPHLCFFFFFCAWVLVFFIGGTFLSAFTSTLVHFFKALILIFHTHSCDPRQQQFQVVSHILHFMMLHSKQFLQKPVKAMFQLAQPHHTTMHKWKNFFVSWSCHQKTVVTQLFLVKNHRKFAILSQHEIEHMDKLWHSLLLDTWFDLDWLKVKGGEGFTCPLQMMLVSSSNSVSCPWPEFPFLAFGSTWCCRFAVFFIWFFLSLATRMMWFGSHIKHEHIQIQTSSTTNYLKSKFSPLKNAQNCFFWLTPFLHFAKQIKQKCF